MYICKLPSLMSAAGLLGPNLVLPSEVRGADGGGPVGAGLNAGVGGRGHPDLLLGGRRLRRPPRLRQLQQVQQQLLQVWNWFWEICVSRFGISRILSFTILDRYIMNCQFTNSSKNQFKCVFLPAVKPAAGLQATFLLLLLLQSW